VIISRPVKRPLPPRSEPPQGIRAKVICETISQTTGLRGCRIEMSIFPTKMLLATDGSEEAQLAAKTAAELARSTGSELHVIHVFLWARPTAFDPISLDTTVHEAVDSRARERLEEIVRRIEASGGVVRRSHLKRG
jgi:hypothetical protein